MGVGEGEGEGEGGEAEGTECGVDDIRGEAGGEVDGG